MPSAPCSHTHYRYAAVPLGEGPTLIAIIMNTGVIFIKILLYIQETRCDLSNDAFYKLCGTYVATDISLHPRHSAGESVHAVWLCRQLLVVEFQLVTVNELDVSPSWSVLTV